MYRSKEAKEARKLRKLQWREQQLNKESQGQRHLKLKTNI